MTSQFPHVNPPADDMPSTARLHREGRWTLHPSHPMTRAEFDDAVDWYGCTVTWSAYEVVAIAHARDLGLLLELAE